MYSKKRSLSVKGKLLIVSSVPVVVIGMVLFIIMAIQLRAGMMKEALEGLMASAEMYRTELVTTDNDLSGNELEDQYKKVTGFDFTRFEGDTRASTSVIKADGSRPIGTKAAPEVIEAVLKRGETYTSEKTDVAGEEYCVAYSPIKDASGNITGMAFAGKPTADMNKTIRKSILSILSIGIVIMVITLIIVFFVANKLVTAIIAVNTLINDLSVGVFRKTDVMTDRGDEIGQIINNTNSLVDVLTNVINDIKNIANTIRDHSTDLSDTSSQIRDTTEGVSIAAQELAKGAMDQNESIEKMTDNLDMLSDAIHTVAENATVLAISSAEIDTVSKDSASALSELVDNMNVMEDSVAEIATTMEDTNQAVINVNQKVDGITSIADQTNLLALNASIEAARAGEAGRGFAVVAEEIGNLAKESSNTADEIRQEMKELLSQAGKAREKADEANNIGKNVTAVLNETVEKINTLISSINGTIEGVNNISALTQECDASKVVILESVNSLSSISEENAASTQETSASMQEMSANIHVLANSAQELKTVAEKLDEDLEFFKI
jgi:methyl-accepting chemotaxis protein